MPASLIIIIITLIAAFLIVAWPTTWLMKRWADCYDSALRRGPSRIAYSCVLLCAILQLSYCGPLICDRQSGIIDSTLNAEPQP